LALAARLAQITPQALQAIPAITPFSALLLPTVAVAEQAVGLMDMLLVQAALAAAAHITLLRLPDRAIPQAPPHLKATTVELAQQPLRALLAAAVVREPLAQMDLAKLVGLAV
jgi:hypothetical protein